MIERCESCKDKIDGLERRVESLECRDFDQMERVSTLSENVAVLTTEVAHCVKKMQCFCSEMTENNKSMRQVAESLMKYKWLVVLMSVLVSFSIGEKFDFLIPHIKAIIKITTGVPVP